MKVKEARVVHAIVWLIIFVGKRKQGAETQKTRRTQIKVTRVQNRGNRKKEFGTGSFSHTGLLQTGPTSYVALTCGFGFPLAG